MALSITPTDAWDFTQGNPAGLTSLLGLETVLALAANGESLDAGGLTVNGNFQWAEANPAPAAYKLALPFTLVWVGTVDGATSTGRRFLSLDVANGDGEASFASLGFGTDSDVMFAVSQNGSNAGRLSSLEAAPGETVYCLIAEIGPTHVHMWNGVTAILSGGTLGTIDYGDEEDDVQLRVGTNRANTGTTTHYAALIPGALTSDDRAALAADPHAALFGEGGGEPDPDPVPLSLLSHPMERTIRRNEASAELRRVFFFMHDGTGAPWEGSVTGVKAKLSVNGGTETDSPADIVRVGGLLHYVTPTDAYTDIAEGSTISARVTEASGRACIPGSAEIIPADSYADAIEKTSLINAIVRASDGADGYDVEIDLNVDPPVLRRTIPGVGVVETVITVSSTRPGILSVGS